MKGTFLKHFVIISSGTLISMILGFLSTPIITRIVSPYEYGKYSIFITYANMAVTILYLGLDQAMVRYFYENNTKEYHKELLLKCIRLPIILSFILSIIIIILYISHILNFELDKCLLILLCIYINILIIYRFSLLLVRLQYKSKLYSILGIVQKLVYIILSIFMIYTENFSNIFSLASSTTIAAAICVILSAISEREICFFNPVIGQKIYNIPQKELLKYAYPYIFSTGITILFQSADQIALKLFCSYKEVGIYSSTMTLVHIFAVIQTTFNTLWTPMAVEHYSKDKSDTKFYQKGNQVITIIMFFIGFSLILIKDIFALLLGDKYSEAAYILPFLIFNPIMYTVSETTVNGLVFMKKSKLQVVVSVGACTVNIIGNIILVPRFGCQGAAISTGLSYIVFFSLRTFFSNKYFYVDFKLKKFYFLTLLSVIYSFYNTFVHFNILTIVGYIFCISVIVFMYIDTIKWGGKYLFNYLKKFIQNN